MRPFLLACMILFLGSARSQSPCIKKSILFKFDQHPHPRLFNEKLGTHSLCPFLQYIHGTTTRALFIKAAKDPESRRLYKKEFKAFNELLRDVGFANGYK